MRQVFKYAFPIRDEFEIGMPGGAKIVLVESQIGSGPCIWALVDVNEQPKLRKFVLRGTGHPIPGAVNHVASFQAPPFVWHLFEKVITTAQN